MIKPIIYLDNNATTKVDPLVIQAMIPIMEKEFGNPSSQHFLGTQAAELRYRATQEVSAFLGCHCEEIIFTSGGTESNNLAIRGVCQSLSLKKRHIITSAVEHPAVKQHVMDLAKQGYSFSEIKVDEEGMLDMEEYKAAFTENTGLVSIMYANNETGVIFPIEEIGKIAKERGAIFHVDAVQAIGKIPINLSHSFIDLLSLSGHKFHAPKGIGVLYIREGTPIQPQILGGHQQKGLRAGTEAMPNIVALGKACQLAGQSLQTDLEKIQEKRDRLEKWILENIPKTRLNGHKNNRLPNTSNVSFYKIPGESLLFSLSKEGICVSTGAACFSGSVKPSHVLTAMKVPPAYIQGSIRFSLSRYTTDEEISYVIEKLPKILERIHSLTKF